MADLQIRLIGGFLLAMSQTTRFHVRVCFLGVENLKLIFNSSKIPQSRKLG